jgi:Cu+-exporting ATPase
MGLFGGASRLNFNQSPLDKLAFIQRLQDSGRVVMMVGDGLNDAGALRQSDIGVAVVESIGAFSPASDVILEGGRVPCLNSILLMARDATRIVRLSFGISAFYNLAGIGVAASGLLSPLVCAVLMPLSSLSVVLFACGATAWRARKRFDGFDRVTSDRVGRGLSAGRSSDLAGPDLEGRRAVTGASLGAGFAKEGAA